MKSQSYFFSYILRLFIALAEEACDSSEDMPYRVNQCNINHNITDDMIGSFDVEALYSSININFAVQKCLELISESESESEFKSGDTLKLGLYLSILMDKKRKN